MATNVIPGNDWLKWSMQTAKARLNATAGVRLFVNDFEPLPQSEVADFQEAVFSGYARWALTGAFGDPLKVQDGEYAIETVYHTFTCTANSTQSVYGYFVVLGGKVQFSGRLPAPVPMLNGSTVTLKLTIEAGSTAALCPIV